MSDQVQAVDTKNVFAAPSFVMPEAGTSSTGVDYATKVDGMTGIITGVPTIREYQSGQRDYLIPVQVSGKAQVLSLGASCKARAPQIAAIMEAYKADKSAKIPFRLVQKAGRRRSYWAFAPV